MKNAKKLELAGCRYWVSKSLRESRKNVIQFATLCVSNKLEIGGRRFRHRIQKVMMTSLNSSFRRPEAAHSPINTQGCECIIAKSEVLPNREIWFT